MSSPSAPEPSEAFDNTWVVAIHGFQPLQERAAESLLALANGYIGTRASLPEGNPASDAGTFVAGVFTKADALGIVPELMEAPDWLSLTLEVEGEVVRMGGGDVLDHYRQLDLRKAEWTRDWRHCDRNGRITRLHFLQCISLADRHILLQRLEITPENYTGEIRITLRIDPRRALLPETHSDFLPGANHEKASEPIVDAELLPDSDGALVLRALGSGVKVAFASRAELEVPAHGKPSKQAHTVDGESNSWTVNARLGSTYRLNRTVCVFSSRDGSNPGEAAVRHLRAPGTQLFDGLLAAHEEEWANRWRQAAVRLEGDPHIAQALHLATYHLLSGVNPGDEHASVGARGLTGHAYRGHVFWDTEVFMLPFFVLAYPPAARALLMYRFHTLPAARLKAESMGYRGALYAWESADDGSEATPAEVLLPDGALVTILSGFREHHISADVAYAVWLYWTASGDDEFFLSAGAEMLLETARFWASRATLDEMGRYHIRETVGPDEYHDAVDDNAYTNLMARWNLLRGRDAATSLAASWPSVWESLSERMGLALEEIEEWGLIGERLVDGRDSATEIIEQFAGYTGLEEVDLSTFEPRSIPMDLLLGHDRIAQTKIIKQADVVMALALLWDEFPDDVRKKNFSYYEPRTAHGSSLSPGIHALVAARLGELGKAERFLRQTAAIDLDDQLANASGGIHMAALGSLWQAVVFGFLGVQILRNQLVICPRLASLWQHLGTPLCWRGRQLYLEVDGSRQSWQLRLDSGAPLVASDGGERIHHLTVKNPLEVGALGHRYEIHEGTGQ